ncbi:hypothetical protein [Brevundimonas sp. NIBR11]|uniref:hypothetical protein n=1 Tax=Brevundimonas sp. NIBR11 TaxID=3015999 RepID=UPI0022F116BA|nr:hypothetical protein [Brevundimonas sp. NIBR11]WGM31469.1 hypothetical protein KKHFBJBL_01716 [Brevundimonas sp. NIBR11]
MARKTIYCAQPFWCRQGLLQAGLVHEFHTEDRARTGGEILAGAADGVAVFSLTGEPDIDLWGEPVMISTIGQVPGAEPCSDPWDCEAA